MASTPVFEFEEEFKVTEEMKQTYWEHGYILIRCLLDLEEVAKLRTALENDAGVRQHSYPLADGLGTEVQMCLWQHPGNDVTGMLARCHKVAQTMEDLLGDEVYHYHSKLLMKNPGSGGAFLWHQDYGYWYNNGCLYPDYMAAFFTTLDPCTKENGCLEVLPGTHKCGRIEHTQQADQRHADQERVDELMKKHPLVHVEQNPGDALFFHSNLLHRSGQNRSGQRRWAFNISYNTRRNDPVRKHHHPNYTPLLKVPNDAIKKSSNETNLEGKDFHSPQKELYPMN